MMHDKYFKLQAIQQISPGPMILVRMFFLDRKIIKDRI